MKGIKEPSQQTEHEYKLEFSCDIDYTLPIFMEKNFVIEDTESIKNNLENILNDFYEAAIEHNGQKAYELGSTGGIKYWGKISTAMSDKDILQTKNEIIKFYSSAESMIGSFEVTEIKYLFGKSLVLAYRQSDNEPGIFKITDSSNYEYWISTVLFAKVNNEWIVWHMN
ncbi:MAG: hypothetical protein GY869_01670 [Planctomycetes bacterium]|nr:hypothetical protein [Planctomycetota bacterium]